jgi:hypothetical protein
MRQAQDLQQHNNNSSSMPAAGSLGRQRLQSVLLAPQADAASAGDSSTGKQPAPGSSRGLPQRQQQPVQPADAISSQSSLERDLLGSPQSQQKQHHPSSRQQQQQRTAEQLVGGSQQQAPIADFVALQQQMAQLQHTLASQQQQQQQLMQPPQHAGVTLPFNGALPQLAPAGRCYQGPPSPSPWPQGPVSSPYVQPPGLSSYSPPPMMHTLAPGVWPSPFSFSPCPLSYCSDCSRVCTWQSLMQLRRLTPACSSQAVHGATCPAVL